MTEEEHEEEQETEPTKLCFVVSPIGTTGSADRIHADWLLKGIIEPVFRQHFKEFRVERADKINAPGMIDSQVINRLLDSELVIADMSLLNANAFYEMGIRHMKQRPIIHMYRTGEPIPFDVAPHRAIPFSYAHPDDLVTAQIALKASVDEVIKPDFQVENPVTRARGTAQIQEHATPGQRVLLDQVSELSSRLSRLEMKDTGTATSRNKQAIISALLKTSPSGFYGGSEFPMHSGSTLLSFITQRRFMVEQADIIQSALAQQFGHAARISQGATEIVFAVPGDININDFEIPAGLPKDLEISPLRPYPGSP
jgi:hypothetical protein